MKIQYLDKHGLGTLISLVKRGQTGVYTVKGTAIYADAAFLALTPAEKEAIDVGASAINAAGLWQKSSGAYAQVTTFEEGWVYDIINAFSTDANFREGAGYPVEAGMNIVAVNTGTAASPVLMWDLFSGLLNLDKYQTKKLVDASGIEVFDNTEFQTVFPAITTVTEANLPAPATFTGATAEADAKAAADAAMYVPAVMESDGANLPENTCIRFVPTVTDDGAGTYTVTYNYVVLGDQTTVEGMLKFLGHTCPNTPITDAEIEDIWDNI